MLHEVFNERAIESIDACYFKVHFVILTCNFYDNLQYISHKHVPKGFYWNENYYNNITFLANGGLGYGSRNGALRYTTWRQLIH